MRLQQKTVIYYECDIIEIIEVTLYFSNQNKILTTWLTCPCSLSGLSKIPPQIQKQTVCYITINSWSGFATLPPCRVIQMCSVAFFKLSFFSLFLFFWRQWMLNIPVNWRRMCFCECRCEQNPGRQDKLPKLRGCMHVETCPESCWNWWLISNLLRTNLHTLETTKEQN